MDNELNELIELANILDKLYRGGNISESDFKYLFGLIQKEVTESDFLSKGKITLDDYTQWEENEELRNIWNRKNTSSLKIPGLKNNVEFVEINLEEPDNSWYHIILETGEQIIFGNFSEKVTISGVVGQVVVGEIPFVGTVADVRDISADIANWEWTWEHAGTTALDVIGLVPIIGSFKYADEAGELISAGVKHLDEIGDVGKKSDELAEIVGESITKHLDESNEIANGAQAISNASSKVLRKNMINAGIKIPDYPHAAHHIVAGTSKKAEEARKILEKFDIDINDAANGVFLPTEKNISEAMYHPSLHTNKYYDEVNQMLREAETRDDVLDILELISQKLLDGTFLK